MDIRTIFETPFDHGAYMEEALLRIDDLEDRAFARAYLLPCLNRIFEESEATYRRLEDRVYAEIQNRADKYSVALTVVEREQFDITNGVWFPVVEGEEKNPKQDDEAIAEAVERESFFDLETVFFRAGAGQCMTVAAERERRFRGTVQTGQGEYEAEFVLVPEERYLRAAEHFYTLCLRNDVPWTTLNCGYLLKFFTVRARLLGEKLGQQETVTGYTADFEELASGLRAGHIPVWNVRKLLYDSTDFVVPVIDTKLYEHEFPVRKYGAENGYLIESNADIVSFRQTEEKIIIATALDTFSKWVAYMVVADAGENPHHFREDVLTNRRHSSFVQRYVEHNGLLLQTKAECIRRVEQFQVEQYLALRDITLITDTTERYCDDFLSVHNVSAVENMPTEFLRLENMNWFIRDELVNRNEQKVLLFTFERMDDACYLNEDIAAFIISQLQRSFNEYRCEAVWGGQGPQPNANRAGR